MFRFFAIKNWIVDLVVENLVGHRARLAMGAFCVLLMLVPSVAEAKSDLAKEVNLDKPVGGRYLMDLGQFHVKDWRPVHNETVKLHFQLYLALDESTSPEVVDQLQFWKHRFRNQVFIAVRLSDRQDFLEPELIRLRQRVALRLNRLLDTEMVEDVLVAEFTITTN